MNRVRLAARLSTRVARDPLLRLLRDCALESAASLYLVGGPVRDAALGRPGKDADLTVVRRALPLLREIKRRLGTRGFRFRKRGITTWRFATPSGQVDIVDAVRRGLEHDLRRRELTINAMAYDLDGGGVVDPLGGLEDLRKKRLRAPATDTFRADPARCLRAARFLAELPGFRIDGETRRRLTVQAPRLRRVAVERVREELNKLLGAGRPHDGLAAIHAWGLLDPLLPELSPLHDYAAGRNRPDVWRHTLETIEMSATRSRLPSFATVRDRGELSLLRWTLLLHDIAKPDTFALESGKPTFHGHEVVGAKLADALLRRLRFDAHTRRRITQLIRWHLRPGHLADAGAPPRGMRRLARDAADDLPLLCLHAACDARGSGATSGGEARWRRMSRVLRSLPEVQSRLRKLPDTPLLSGADIIRITGIPPGPRIGELLRKLAEARDDGLISTRRQAQTYLKKMC